LTQQIDRYTDLCLSGWRGVIRQDWLDIATRGDVLKYFTESPHEEVKVRLSATVLRVQTDHGEVYVKHLKARNDTNRWHDRIKWYVSPSRAMRVWRVVRQMQQKGVLTPPIVLAARRRSYWRSEELIVTEAVDRPTFHAVLLAQDSRQAKIDLISLVAKRIAQFHQLGFIHGDLLPRNLFLTPDNNLVYLDNDRTRIAKAGLGFAARKRNLVQLLFRLIRCHGNWIAGPFLNAYCNAYQGRGNPRRFAYMVLRQIRRRLLTYPSHTGVRQPRSRSHID